MLTPLLWTSSTQKNYLFLQLSLFHSNMELQSPVQEQGVVSWLMVIFSLIPTPFLYPVLDCLQYAKRRGKAWEICHVHCDVITGRHMGGGVQ